MSTPLKKNINEPLPSSPQGVFLRVSGTPGMMLQPFVCGRLRAPLGNDCRLYAPPLCPLLMVHRCANRHSTWTRLPCLQTRCTTKMAILCLFRSIRARMHTLSHKTCTVPICPSKDRVCAPTRPDGWSALSSFVLQQRSGRAVFGL